MKSFRTVLERLWEFPEQWPSQGNSHETGNITSFQTVLERLWELPEWWPRNLSRHRFPRGDVTSWLPVETESISVHVPAIYPRTKSSSASVQSALHGLYLISQDLTANTLTLSHVPYKLFSCPEVTVVRSRSNLWPQPTCKRICCRSSTLRRSSFLPLFIFSFCEDTSIFLSPEYIWSYCIE